MTAEMEAAQGLWVFGGVAGKGQGNSPARPPRLKPSEATRMRCNGINRRGAACTALGYIRRSAATSFNFNQTVRRETLWVLKGISQISGTPHPTLCSCG